MMEAQTTEAWDNLPMIDKLRRTHWDAYKDAYGVRPRHVYTTSWEEIDFIREIEFLGREIANQQADINDMHGV